MYRSVNRRRVPQFICSWMLFAVVILLPALASAAAGDLTLFGPKRYERTQGKPWVFTDSFNGCANSGGQALLRVQNGAGKDSSLSSALIALNGTNVLVETDFKNQTASMERTVTLRPGQNSLNVQLKSGGQKETPFLVVTIIGLSCDSTPPVISAPQPLDGALLNISRPVIAATYADNSGGAGIDPASVRVVLDSSNITASCAVSASGVSCTPVSSLFEGFHNVTVTVTDLLQNPASLSWRFTTDTIAPQVAITAPGNGQYLASRSATVSGSIDDPTAVVMVNGKIATISGAVFSVADVPLVEGENAIAVSAVDPVGNRTESSIKVTVDTTLPQVTVTTPLDGSFTSSKTISVSGYVSEPPVSVLVNGAPAAITGKDFVLDGFTLAEGLNVLTVEAADPVNHKGTVIVNVNLDTVNPAISLTSPKDELTRNPSLTVSGSVSEPVTSLTINGLAVTVAPDLTFSSGVTLTEGSNSILLEAKDRAGNKGSSTITIILDSTAPTAPRLDALTTPTNISPVTVSGSAEPLSSVALYNGSERVATIVTPGDGRLSFPGIVLREGENSFTATALDLAGNESAPSIPVTVVLDSKPPVAGIVTPLDKTILNTPVITVSGPIDDPTAAVTVNGLAALNSGGIWTLEGFTLQEGSNTLLVEARDPAGNLGKIVIGVTLDTVKPLGTIAINAGAPFTAASRVNLTLSATDANGVTQMQLSSDGSSWSDPEAYSATREWDLIPGDGIKSVFVKYMDRAGNWSEPVSATITLDTFVPVVSATPTGGLYRTPQTVTLSASEAAAIYYTLDATTPTVASALYSQPVSIPASATLSFFAKDLAGNQGPVKSESYTIDTIPPVVKITSHASGQYLSTPVVTVAGSLDDPTAAVTVNNRPALVAGNSFTLAGVNLQEGANTILVEAKDPAGNSGTDSITLNLDTIPPALTVSTLSDNSFTSSETLNISGTVTDAGGLDKLLINGVNVPVNADNSYSHALVLKTGANSITVEAMDKAANKSTNSRTINLDQTAPKITVSAPADNSKTGVKLIEVSGTVDEPVSSLTVNGQAATMNGLAFTAIVIPEYGYNTIEIIAKDLAMNPGSQKRTVIFDDKKPSVAITTPAQDLRTNQASLLVKGSASDTDSLTAVTVTITKDNETFTPPVTNGSFEQAVTFTAEKSYTITVTAKDEAGNETSVQRNIIYDITPPAVTANPNDTPVNQSTQTIGGSMEAGATVVVTSSTALVGPITYTSPTTWQATVTGLGIDKNDFTVTASDAAGNQKSTTTSIVYDNTPPVITVTAPQTGAFVKTPQVTVSGTVNEPVTSVTVNGLAASLSGNSFSAVITLAEGVNSLTVSAVDLAANNGTIAVPVNLDTVPPTVTITTPANGLLTKIPQLTVSGTVSEENTIVSVNGQAATVTGLTFTSALTLIEGQNSISVQAVDRAGNSGSALVAVKLDATAPAAPQLLPLKTPTNVAAVTISGTAEAGSTVKITTGGALIGSVTADPQGNFVLPNVTLAEGDNSYSAIASDAAGNNSAQATQLNVTLDTKAPVITVTAPQAGVVINTPDVAITGSVNEPLASLTINGAAVTLDPSLAFTTTMALAAGSNSALIIAIDPAGNVATTTLTIMRDSTPPVVAITAPQAGLLTKNSAIQVSGTVDDAEASLTVNGAAVTNNNKTFNFTYTLSEGDNSISVEATDKAGNKGTAATSVTLDATVPQISINAPLEAAAGANITINLTASDNRQLTLVELKADGVPIWSGGNGPAIQANVAYRLSPSLNAGAAVTFQAKAIDTAGNEGAAIATIRITQAAMGPGYLQGKVLEDSRGLKLEGATVAITDAKGVAKELTTVTDGGYFLETPAGSTLVKVTKSGYTTVERTVPVIPEKNSAVLDARLTKIDAIQNIINATGGTAKASPFIIQNSPFIIELTVPAGALGSSQDLRLTPVSNQGLAGLLPLGWSPLAAVDIRSLDPQAGTALETTFTAAATVKLPLPAAVTIDPAALPMLARYDETAHQWLAVKAATIDSSSAMAEITTAGQYALVLADTTNAPPAAVAGAPLAAAAAVTLDYTAVTTTGKVVPQAAPPSTGVKAAGEVVLTAKEGATPVFTSGLILASRITEKFDLKSGDKVESPVYNQDIVLYRYPCSTSIGAGAVTPFAADGAGLRTTFPVSPSKDYTIVDLLLGKVGIEVIKPDTLDSGVMVGVDGGRLVDADGNILAIPQGALTQTTPVSTRTAAAATGAVGSDFTLIRAVELNLTRQTLGQPATISIPAPQGLDLSLPLIVAKQIDVKGVAKLKLVSLARLSGTLISSEPLTPVLANATTQLNVSGIYYFLQAKAPIGFVTGTVSDSGNAPFTGALVKSDSGSLVDLSAGNGKYLVAAPVAPFVATAIDLYKGDETTASSALTAASQVVTVDLRILMIPPQIATITPSNGAVKVQPDVPVVVTFSKPMDKSSITSTTLRLSDSTGATVTGSLTFSVDNRTVTFYSAEAFKQETGYSVTIAGTVKDLQGYALGQDVVSTFTVRRTTPPVMPAAGAISGTFPDADGFITVTATQGSADPADTVLLINDTTGEITSITPLSNGSFTGRVRGQLGDEIKVVLMDYSGNQTIVSYITFRNSDGSYLVTAKGGKVEGEGGSVLDIPEGALVGPAVIKLTLLAEANLPTPLQAPGRYLGAVNIDTGGIPFQKKVDVSMPLPDGFDPKTPVFLVSPSTIYNSDGTVEKVYEVIDSTKVVGNRITTACWPFDGLMGWGSYVFASFQNETVGIVSGFAYQETNDSSGYQPPPAGVVETPRINTATGEMTYTYDKPVKNAVIRTPAAWNYVSYSRSNGFYSGFTTLITVPGMPDLEYKVTATHPLTMQKETKTGYLSGMTQFIRDLNFKLAEKNTIPPDYTPPAIEIDVQIAPDQPGVQFVAGTLPVNAKVQIPVTVFDQGMTTPPTLSIQYRTLDATSYSTVASPTLTATGVADYKEIADTGIKIKRYTYQPSFGATGYQLTRAGLYLLTVDAKDAAGNPNTRSIQLRVVEPGEIPDGKPGAPVADEILPKAGTTGIMINSPITVSFSEPVDGSTLTVDTFKLVDTSTNIAEPGTITTFIEDGRMKASIVPSRNLAFDRTYEIVLTTGIKDVNEGKALDREYRSRFTTKTPKVYDLTANQFTGGKDIELYNNPETCSTNAYVTAGDNGYRVADVTDPKNPAVVFPTDLSTITKGFSYRYLGIGQDGTLGMTDNIVFADGNQYGYVRFYDLFRNPTDVQSVKSGRERLAEAMSGIPGRVAVSGNYAYIATAAAGLQIVDVEHSRIHQATNQGTDDSTLVGTFDSIGLGYGSPNDIVIGKNNKAYLTTNPGYLISLDLAEPSFPILMNAGQPNGVSVLRIAVATDYSYNSTGSGSSTMDLAVTSSREGKISTIDITDPYNPSYITAVTNTAGAAVLRTVRDISINKNSGLAFATTFDAVLVIDIKDPYNPKLLNEFKTVPGTTTPIGTNSALTQRDGWVYLASDQKGLRTMDFYTPPLNAKEALVTINSVDDVTVDLDGYSQNELKVNYVINPPGYVANDAKAILVENGVGIKTVSGSISGLGSAVFPRWIKFDVTKKYEVNIVLNCSEPKVSERKDVKVKLSAGCKVLVNGVITNITDGERSTDDGSCCFAGDKQNNNPIINLEKCPMRVQNTKWIKEYDGCTNVPNNPAMGFDTSFSSAECRNSKTIVEKEANCGSLPCDIHDTCYQTCSLTGLYAGELACDDGMKENMLKVCDKSTADIITATACYGWVETYYIGLRGLGRFVYPDRQKQVCNCCS